MFTKQVPEPLAQRGFPVVAAEAEQVERTRRKTWSQAESRVSVPFTPTCVLSGEVRHSKA